MYENQLKNQDFTNDIVFKAVLTKNKELCKEMIARCVPDIEIGEIEIVESEKEVSTGIENKKIRIDAYTSDKRHEYAIEMMTYRIEEIEKYARYHQSMLDAQLELGSLPNMLKNTIVIILCTFDPLGMGLPVYTVGSMIKENGKAFEDGRRIVIVTSKGEEKASKEVRPIVQLLAKKPGEDRFTKEVQSAVENVKMKVDIRRALMDQELRDYLMKKEATEKGLQEGREKGLQEGREKGLQEGREQGLKEGIKEGKEQGLKQGIEQGSKETTEQIVSALMKNLNISKEKALELIVPQETQE